MTGSFSTGLKPKWRSLVSKASMERCTGMLWGGTMITLPCPFMRLLCELLHQFMGCNPDIENNECYKSNLVDGIVVSWRG